LRRNLELLNPKAIVPNSDDRDMVDRCDVGNILDNEYHSNFWRRPVEQPKVVFEFEDSERQSRPTRVK
jgi:hypothetical protein